MVKFEVSSGVLSPIGSMVLLYMVTWIPSIYPKCLYMVNVTIHIYIYIYDGPMGSFTIYIYTSTMDPSWVIDTKKPVILTDGNHPDRTCCRSRPRLWTIPIPIIGLSRSRDKNRGLSFTYSNHQQRHFRQFYKCYTLYIYYIIYI